MCYVRQVPALDKPTLLNRSMIHKRLGGISSETYVLRAHVRVHSGLVLLLNNLLFSSQVILTVKFLLVINNFSFQDGCLLRCCLVKYC
jgi:hypothetical protein